MLRYSVEYVLAADLPLSAFDIHVTLAQEHISGSPFTATTSMPRASAHAEAYARSNPLARPSLGLGLPWAATTLGRDYPGP